MEDSKVLKIYRMFAAFWSKLLPAAEVADPMQNFTSRDWADLPTYHPRSEGDACPR
ncbi:MAG: hypothetical protein JWN11_834 [Hyphomicrobiales bacterium]|nr:hypothetical protein [Hyphomicrobiales bacterium]